MIIAIDFVTYVCLHVCPRAYIKKHMSDLLEGQMIPWFVPPRRSDDPVVRSSSKMIRLYDVLSGFRLILLEIY